MWYTSAQQGFTQIQIPTAPPPGDIYQQALCSHAAVLEKQQANWHFPAAQPNMVKNWH